MFIFWLLITEYRLAWLLVSWFRVFYLPVFYCYSSTLARPTQTSRTSTETFSFWAFIQALPKWKKDDVCYYRSISPQEIHWNRSHAENFSAFSRWLVKNLWQLRSYSLTFRRNVLEWTNLSQKKYCSRSCSGCPELESIWRRNCDENRALRKRRTHRSAEH